MAEDADGVSEYYKVLMIKPLCDLYPIAKAHQKTRDIFFKFIGADSNFDIHDLFSNENISSINNKNGNFISIDMDKSSIYASRTRSDGDMISEALKYIVKRVDMIKSDYYNTYSKTSVSSRIKNRVNKISSYTKV
jgi:hypothetical protein